MAEDYSYDVGLTRTFIQEPGGGEIRPSTSGDASKDGGLETLTVCDETHLYLQALKDMYDTVERNCRKREMDEPLLLRTTTAYSPGEAASPRTCGPSSRASTRTSSARCSSSESSSTTAKRPRTST
jgi:hypothetical protein